MPDIISNLTPEGTPERCGIVTQRGKVVELTNIHDNPIEGFRFAAEDTLEWLASGKATSTWHTHPGEDPNLSEEDYAGFLQWPDITHWIAGVRDGEALAVEFFIDAGLVVEK